MDSVRTRLLIAGFTLLAACALPRSMPPFSATKAYAVPGGARTSTLPASRVFRHHKHIASEYDSSTDQTRLSITTHRGVDFLWIQHPRVTFLAVYPGATRSGPPANVFVIVRTVDPQVPATNQLHTECDGVRAPIPVTPVFWLEPGPMTWSRHYMYDVGLSQIASLTACHRLTIAVGDAAAAFADDQLEALRDFASQLQQ